MISVTLRSSDPPDVYVQEHGANYNLVRLDTAIQTLILARCWLMWELERKERVHAESRGQAKSGKGSAN